MQNNTTTKHLEGTMSKLYTQEQVRKAIKLAQKCESDCGGVYFDYENTSEIIEELNPIELPTLEEIELKSVEYSTDDETKEFYKDCCWDFQNGAKWMRDKIKGGGDEN